ncbi:MAG: protease pro-enzyme activation domain-containing protein [Dokdonella sp.]
MIAFASASVSHPVLAAAERVALAGHQITTLNQAKADSVDTALLTLTVTLRRDDEAGFQQYLRDVYDPQSAIYRQFLSPRDVAARFGPSQQAYDAVAGFFSAQRFTTLETSPNRLTLTLAAARVDAEAALAVTIHDYASAERAFYANDRDPSLPGEIAAHVQSIAGLSSLARPGPLTSNSSPPAYFQCPAGQTDRCDLYGPLCAIYAASRATGELLQKLEGTGKGIRDYAKAYNTHNENVQKYYEACLNNQFPAAIEPIHLPQQNAPSGGGVPWRSVDGSGQKIGLVEFDLYQTSDIAAFLQLIGSPAEQISQLSDVTLGGGASFGAAESEVVLDIDTVMGLAPGADIVVYNASFSGAGSSFQSMFNRMINDGVDVISNSWAYCENQTSQADVDSIESILQAAAASGISVYSGSGDSGSTCLSGAANTAAVPATSPHITAVGGSSLVAGAGGIYRGETWWDGSASSPPTGQGGFGTSRFFARPSYQDGFTPSTQRSVPDVVANADPNSGVIICQADAGGCPTPYIYGGTSLATPIWAAFTALLNQARGSNLGFANAGLYPLAAGPAFRSAASMSSDFAHVGLGSPNIGALNLLLQGATAGTPSVTLSEILATAPPVAPFTTNYGVPADGVNPGVIVVTLLDANGNTVAGKTVGVAANAGNHATVTPPNEITGSDGVAVFKVTDLVAEELTFTVTDTSDAIELATNPSLPFIAPPASTGGLSAFPADQTADGIATSAVTVTLHDALGRGVAGKQVQLVQNGHALILGDNPAATDANGEAIFSVSDQSTEVVAFSAVDLTDGSLPVPGAANVNFSDGVGCGAVSAPVAAPGFAISLYASGFPTQNGVNFGNITLNGCIGATGIAFDASGRLFAADYVTGDIYAIPAGGGVADASTRITATPIGPGITALAFGDDGSLYGSRIATSGDFTTGAVLRINSSNGATTAIANNLKCPFSMSADPLSGDLFLSDGCFGAGSDDPSIWRVANPAGGSPTTSIYASTNASPNGSIGFAEDGTMYIVAQYTSVVAGVDAVSGTDQPQPATVTSLGVYSTFAVAPIGSASGGGAAGIIVGASRVGGFDQAVAVYDLTATQPVFSGGLLEETGAGAPRLIGPDGCIYLNAGVAVYRLSNADGTCPLPAQLVPNPSIVLSPNSGGAAIAAQGTSQGFLITFPHSDPPVGTPVTVVVQGANSLQQIVVTGFGTGIGFSYVGAAAGEDDLVAYATLDGELVSSNQVHATWTSGAHTSFLSLNGSDESGGSGAQAQVQATLLDRSVTPAVPIAGASVGFTLAGATCSASTDASGVARCAITLASPAVTSLAASYAGDGAHLPASASIAFHVLTDRIFANGFDGP